MLLQRSLLILDGICLISIVTCLAFLPAERCATFEHESLQHSKCQLHPVQALENDLGLKHETTICHRLSWSHYAFWKNMYVLIIPAICCSIIIFFIFAEMLELDMFLGRVQTRSMILLSIFTICYTIAVILFEMSRLRDTWKVQLGGTGPTSLKAPDTWHYSLMMCVLSALFKLGRIIVQHYFGDKKMSFDEDDSNSQTSDA